MDNGLLIGLIALIFFSILLIISVNNDNKKDNLSNITDTLNSEEQKIALLTELLITEKSSNKKLNIIMWIMLIPIIINIIIAFLTISAANEIIAKITSLL